ncbi:hypothetical protein T10_12482 [Trichinella papuae]|uniref:Uncharacterized protein n=1 Tax=Trichinella papuae TaxID=268474 RepID=A0A0V1M0I4_9BILA|nr:hypothetical protein T10_12482 [Trichinella papuae]
MASKKESNDLAGVVLILCAEDVVIHCHGCRNFTDVQLRLNFLKPLQEMGRTEHGEELFHRNLVDLIKIALGLAEFDCYL